MTATEWQTMYERRVALLPWHAAVRARQQWIEYKGINGWTRDEYTVSQEDIHNEHWKPWV